MTRHCSGEDPNLLMHVDPMSGERIEKYEPGMAKTDQPCTCGLVFNDERRSTIYPHERI